MEPGFYFSRLEARGTDRTPAHIEFQPGLNVISGASDTGKSYLVDCLNYMLGGGTPPKDIEESRGYETLWLEIRDWGTTMLTLERSLRSGDFRLYRAALDGIGSDTAHTTLKAKHSKGSTDSVSGLLLTLCNLTDKVIRTNAKGDTRSLSFRDVANMTIVREERIYTTESPIYATGQVIHRTAEQSFFRFLLTGVDDRSVISQSKAREDQAARQATLRAIEEIIAETEESLTALTDSPDEIQSQLARVMQSIQELTTTVSADREKLRYREGQRQELWGSIHATDARSQVLLRLLNRFQLLERHYESDLARLKAIAEAGKYLSELPQGECPVCGASLADASGGTRSTDVELLRAASERETRRTSLLQGDLTSTMKDLRDEQEELERQRNRESRSYERVVQQIEEELLPSESVNRSELEQLLAVQNRLERAEGILSQLVLLRTRHSALSQQTVPSRKQAKAVEVPTSAKTSETEEFSQVVEAVLGEWNFPDRGRVTFSEDNQDLVINGQDRKNHGKGIRALTYAAFIVSLLRYCRAKGRPHPGVVVVDSPLVAYREPDSFQQVSEAGVKDAFFRSLARLGTETQVVVFENEDPPTDLMDSIKYLHFSKTTAPNTRYGFFPGV
jgi:hypothetical protein